MAARPLGLAPRKVFDGYGFAVRAVSPTVRPRDAGEVAEIFRRASQERIPVGLRANGRSYGDASLNARGVVLDMMGMNRILSLDAERGIVEVEPGVTIGDLWRHVLPHGWWPTVVPGTMHATLAGCAAMNVHGKNHYKVGGTGDSVLDADLVTPDGVVRRISREDDAPLFRAAIGSFGTLGAFTRIRLQLKRVESGRMRVWQIPAPSLDAQFDVFAEHTADSDYLVSWVDCIAGGSGLGRGQAHRAVYLHADEDPDGARMLAPERQDLPGHILGVPKALVPKILRIFSFNAGMHLLNTGKYLASALGPRAPYLQAHVAFQFLLDYVPGFRSAYEPGGFIQYQPFLPRDTARETLRAILARTQAAGLVSYLGVLKRHRPDDFLLSHALDGYSLAMDFPVTASNRADLFRLCHDLNDLVCEAGGRFYPAKDLTMRPQDFGRAWGQERLAALASLRARVDPEGVLRTDLAARVGAVAPR